MSKVLVAIQARNNSTRLPNKISLSFGTSTVLQTLLDTCKQLKNVNVQVISAAEDPVEGSYISPTPVNDLVARYVDAVEAFDAHKIIRLTADCPLIPHGIIQAMIERLKDVDYVSNINPRTFPDGYDCQGISRKALDWINTHQQSNREHPFYDLEYNCMFEQSFKDAGFTIDRMLNHDQLIVNPHHPDNKLSIDTEADYRRCKKVWEKTCGSLVV